MSVTQVNVVIPGSVTADTCAFPALTSKYSSMLLIAEDQDITSRACAGCAHSTAFRVYQGQSSETFAKANAQFRSDGAIELFNSERIIAHHFETTKGSSLPPRCIDCGPIV